MSLFDVWHQNHIFEKWKPILSTSMWTNLRLYEHFMVGDQLPSWMGYQTNNTKMWPWTKQISNIHLHMSFTWLCSVIGLICISQHKILIFPVTLCKGCPKSQSVLIHMQFKRMIFNGSPQNGCKTKLSFQLLKNLFLCIPPYNRFINLGRLSKGFC